MCLQYPLLSCTARRDLPSVNLQFGKAAQYTTDHVVLILNQILINIQFLSLFSLGLLQWMAYTAWQGAYELFVGKQPIVGAGLPRPSPIYRPVSPWSSSKRRPINLPLRLLYACLPPSCVIHIVTMGRY